MKKKAFDCVEMKRQAQARLMAAYEARKNEFSSYAEFVHETAAADPTIQAFRAKLADAQCAVTSDTASKSG